MRASLERQVRKRAGDACEYCRLPQSAFRFTFPIDHIIAEFHGGKTVLKNLAVACLWCNLYKGTNIAGIDPISKEIVPLFHPRKQEWGEHFQWRGPRIIGVTPIGRATIRTLKMNRVASVAIRRSLIAEEDFPPRG